MTNKTLDAPHFVTEFNTGRQSCYRILPVTASLRFHILTASAIFKSVRNLEDASNNNVIAV